MADDVPPPPPPPPPPPGPADAPPPPPPGYGTPTYDAPGYSTGAARTEGTAIAAFVVALVSMFACGIVTGIVALVLASNAAQKIAASGGQLTGTGFVTAARVIAIIAIVLNAVVLVFVLTAS